MELNGAPLVMHEAPKIHLTNSAPTFLFRNNHGLAQKEKRKKGGYDQFYANNIFSTGLQMPIASAHASDSRTGCRL